VNEGNRTLAAALAYAGRGWAIHPIRAGDKRPYLHDWPHRATTEPKTIRQWWAKWPEANVGLACGPSRLTVVDLDVKGGAGGPASWDRPVAGLENGGRVEMRHWARAQEVAERWWLHAHRLYEQVGELAISPQDELEDKVLDAVRRWQGSEKYPGGLTAADIARFVWGWGAVEVKRCADGLVSAHVLAKHRPGRAERYFEPGPEAEEGTIEEKRNRSVEAAAGQAHDIYRSPAGRGDQQEE
jgi:hypothetical protein